MKYVFKNVIFSYVALFCAALLLLAILDLPSEFYGILRITICVGALWIAIIEFRMASTFFCFALIAYIFNPIVPIFLYQKSIWIPVDIICAALFLLSAFKRKRFKTYVPYANKICNSKSYGRDKKY